MNVETYNVVIAGLFALVLAVLTAWAWLTNKATQDAKNMLPPEYAGLVTGALVLVGMMVKATDTPVDDRAFEAFIRALGIELPGVETDLPKPEEPELTLADVDAQIFGKVEPPVQ